MPLGRQVKKPLTLDSDIEAVNLLRLTVGKTVLPQHIRRLSGYTNVVKKQRKNDNAGV